LEDAIVGEIHHNAALLWRDSALDECLSPVFGDSDHVISEPATKALLHQNQAHGRTIRCLATAPLIELGHQIMQVQDNSSPGELWQKRRKHEKIWYIVSLNYVIAALSMQFS
jgi:hypothetical protein